MKTCQSWRILRALRLIRVFALRTCFITQRLIFTHVVFIFRLIKDGKGSDAVKLIEEISVGRRNLRHKPLIFALARCARCDDKATKDAAYKVFPAVCRTPYHLFLFVKFCEEMSASGIGKLDLRLIKLFCCAPTCTYSP